MHVVFAETLSPEHKWDSNVPVMGPALCCSALKSVDLWLKHKSLMDWVSATGQVPAQ